MQLDQKKLSAYVILIYSYAGTVLYALSAIVHLLSNEIILLKILKFS